MKLIIPAAVERKLNAYVQAVDGEIAGMGKVQLREDGNLWVEDVAIYDQEVSSGTADLSPQSIAQFVTDLVKRGESPKLWCLWWHSHNNFGAFFSPTDTGTIASSTEFDHIVSLVVNKKRERKCRVDTHRPFRLSQTEVLIEVAPEANKESIEIEEQIWMLVEEIKELRAKQEAIAEEAPDVSEEVKEKVKFKTIVTYKSNPMGFGRGGRHMKGDRGYLNEAFDHSWSKKRKKDGTVTTPAIILSKEETINELELLIELTEKTIKAHEANGNGDEVECIELRADLETYVGQLAYLEEDGEDEFGADYIDYSGEDGVPLDEWGYPIINAQARILDDSHVFEDADLPPLPHGYRYGFNHIINVEGDDDDYGSD